MTVARDINDLQDVVVNVRPIREIDKNNYKNDHFSKYLYPK